MDPPLPSTKYFNITQPAEYVTHVEINRPQKLNAFIKEMWLDLSHIFTSLSTSPSTRAIILSGAGPQSFTSGLDVLSAASDPLLLSPSPPTPSSSSSSSPTIDPAHKATHLRHHIHEFQSSISSLSACSKPIICALHGYCLGLGIDIALAADVRICAPGTKFSVKEVDIGLAADIGTLSRMPKVVGNGSWVKDVCISGRGFGAGEAREMGLVSWVGGGGRVGDEARGGGDGARGIGGGGKERAEREKEEVLSKALDWATTVASKSPVAVQGTKELLNFSWDRSVEDGLRYTAVWNSAMLQGRDTPEAMAATMGRRKARFEKL